ncbi:MAG: tetratricopeptide repeat protein [Myxococcota bacterium]
MNELSDAKSPLERSFAMLQQGHVDDAKNILVAEVDKAERAHGKDHPKYAEAQSDLAHLLMQLGDPQVTAALEAAVAVDSNLDEEAQQARLRYLLQLGDVYLRIGKLEEAERRIKETLEGRERTYGTRDPRYALALEPLASIYLARSEAGKAKETIDNCYEVLTSNEHARWPYTMALRALVHKAANGLDAEVFPDRIREASTDEFNSIVVATLNAVREAHPDLGLAVAKDLLLLVEARDAKHEAIPAILSEIGQMAIAVEDPQQGETAYDRLLKLREAQKDDARIVEARMGYAFFCVGTKQLDKAKTHYQVAAEKAVRLGDPMVTITVTRAFAAFLMQTGNLGEAEQQIKKAREEAEKVQHKELMGRTRMDQAMLAELGGRQDQAQALLTESLDFLPEADPDRQQAVKRLKAMQSHETGNTNEAISQLLTELVRPSLPQGLLGKIQATLDKKGGFDVDIQLLREPSEEEADKVQALVQKAISDVNAQLSGRVGTS